MAHDLVYSFAPGRVPPEGIGEDVLGGKGANLAEMSRVGLPVPPGFTITTEHPEALHEVWERHDIPLDMQSCHLSLTSDGDVFVGHVPARFVLKYLADPPKGARGLSVPAMPVGTPGMEQEAEFDPYEVMLLTDGEPKVFADVRKASQQRV